MKITVECSHCGNKVEITPKTRGNVAYFASDLRDEEFHLNDVRIDKELFSENVTDPDDVDTRLKEIRIDCNRCGNYIVLDCD